MNDDRPMTPLDRTIHLLMILCALLWLMFLASVALAQNVQLSPGPVLLTSPATISPDSQRAVYADAAGLWSVPLHGGAPVPLMTLLPGRQVYGAARITPDGARVVYVADQDTLGKPELYSVPISGGASVKLSMDLTALPGQVRDFLISPTSQRVYYAADGAVNNKIELWAVSMSGGRSIRLNHAINAATDVFEYHVSSLDVLVYRSGQSSGSGDFALYSVRGDGLAPAVKISRQMVTGGGVDATFSITSNGETVLYIADAEDNGEFNAYSVDIRGGASHRLNTAVDGGVVDVFEEPVSGGSQAVYAQRTSTVTNWFSVPVTGGTPVPVPPPMPEPVGSPDGQWLLYHAEGAIWSNDPFNINHRVSCSGQTVTTTFLAKPAYSVSPDSKRVVYIAGGEVWTSEIRGSVCLIWKDGFESGNLGGWR